MSELDEEKKFYERFWALHRDPALVEVMARFGVRAFRRSSVLEGFEAFLAETGFSGDHCVEIGTCKGLTALVLARRFSLVTTIDVVPDPQKHEIARHLGITNINFVDVKDNEEKALVINSLSFDGAYVDGDHARDTESDFALVSRGGRVIFHEHWGAQPPVTKLVSRLKASGGSIKTNGKFASWTA